MAAKKETQTYLQIANNIKRRVFAPIYILMGEETFYIDRLQKMIEENALTEDERDFNLTVFYGTDCDMHDIVNTCRRYPAMSQYQVVVLKEAQNASNLDMLKHYAQKPLASTILIVCNKGGTIKAPELMSALQAAKVGVIFESKKLQEADVASVIKNYVQERGCSIDEKSVSMMKDFVGTDVSRLVGELDDRDQLAVGGVFGQVDRRAHAQRQDDDQGEQDDVQGVDDGGQDAVGAAQDAGGGGQEGPVDMRQAADQHHADDAHHQDDDKDGCDPHRTGKELVPQAAGRGEICIAVTFHRCCLLSGRS